MPQKLLASFLFVFVIVPWGWIRRGKTGQRAGNWKARRTTWDRRGAAGDGRAVPRGTPAAAWTASAKPNKGGTR